MRGLVLTLAILSIAAPAAAWQPIVGSAPTWRRAVPYSLHQNGSQDLGGFSSTEPEVRRAMDDWTLVGCTALTTNYQGSTSVLPRSFDGNSVIAWYASDWPHSSGAIGVTGPNWSGSEITEADMGMNGVNFTWTTGGGSFSNVNAYSIILHEGGHFYGLGHSEVGGSAMWPNYSGGVVGLGPDDENGICAMYPGGGADCTTTGCPSGQECMGGACQVVMGDGSFCTTCNTSTECGGVSDACLGYPDGIGYCGRSCGGGDCPGGDCIDTTAGRQCVGIVGGNLSCAGGAPPGCSFDSDCGLSEICSGGTCVPRPMTGAGLGQPCGADAECQSGTCLVGLCSRTCDVLDATGSCPSGFYCDGDIVTSCDLGYCLAGSAGGGGLGQSCTSDTECASLHCSSDGICSQVCIPDGAAGCPAGWACQVGTLACRGSCSRSGAPGDPCEDNADCTSRICASRGADDFCTELCSSTDPCPDRFTCTPIGGDTSVCVPDFGGLGTPCATNEECLSRICALEGESSFCTRICDDVTPCSVGFDCVAVDPMTSVCRPTDTPPMDPGCGCRVVGSPAIQSTGPTGLAWLGLMIGAAFAWRRRRG